LWFLHFRPKLIVQLKALNNPLDTQTQKRPMAFFHTFRYSSSFHFAFPRLAYSCNGTGPGNLFLFSIYIAVAVEIDLNNWILVAVCLYCAQEYGPEVARDY